MAKIITLTIIILTSWLGSNLSANESLKIVKFHLPDKPISVLDSRGNFVKTMALSELPVPLIEVLEYKEKKDLVKILDKQGNEIWLDTFDVALNQGKVVKLDCSLMAEAQPKDKTETGVMGFGGRCNKNNDKGDSK